MVLPWDSIDFHWQMSYIRSTYPAHRCVSARGNTAIIFRHLQDNREEAKIRLLHQNSKTQLSSSQLLVTWLCSCCEGGGEGFGTKAPIAGPTNSDLSSSCPRWYCSFYGRSVARLQPASNGVCGHCTSILLLPLPGYTKDLACCL